MRGKPTRLASPERHAGVRTRTTRRLRVVDAAMSRRYFPAAMRLSARGLVVLVLILLASSIARAEPTPAERALATSLFRAGRALLAEGRFAEACEKLAESQRIDPGGGTLLNLAICHEHLGAVATAWAEFNESLALALRENRTDREDLAREHLASLESRVPKLVVVLADGASVEGLVVSVDNLTLRAAALGTAVPVDPGRHIVSARATGRVTFERPIDVSLGQLARVEIAPLELVPAPPPATTTTAAPPPTLRDERPAARVERRDHDRQLGAFARVDFDGKARGLATVLGAAFGVGNYFEPTLGVIVGPTMGVWPGTSVYFLTGPFKPMVLLGLPIYFAGGPRLSLHGAAGVQWDPLRHVGVFVQVGGQIHPAAPAGYESLELVPSAGVQARL